MAWVCLLLLGLTEAATFNSKVSPVQKVLELLDDLKAKVKNDLANEEKMSAAHPSFLLLDPGALVFRDSCPQSLIEMQFIARYKHREQLRYFAVPDSSSRPVNGAAAFVMCFCRQDE